jgi:hypothetical protein
MTPPDPTAALADTLRALEAQRTRALVARDIETARRLHAPEYQLVTPAGRTFDRDGYLGAIADGSLPYAGWELGPIDVRVGADMALLRYRAVIAFPSGKRVHCWHTDSYERRGGAWLAVWSQATAIKTDSAAQAFTDANASASLAAAGPKA